MMNKIFCFCTLALFFSSHVFASSPTDVVGVWMVPEKDAKVEIYEEDGKFSGKIVWLLEENDDEGNPRLDEENNDPALAKLPLIGLNVVSNFEFDESANRWINGEVYNSRNGKTYAGYMEIQDDGTLLLRGYIKGMKFLGKTNIWERVD